MVGTVASRTTASIKPAPPRGMTTSTRPRAWIRCVTLARSSLGSSCTASAVQTLDDRARRAAPSPARHWSAPPTNYLATAPRYRTSASARTHRPSRSACPRRRCRRRRAEPAADAAVVRWAACCREAPRQSGRAVPRPDAALRRCRRCGCGFSASLSSMASGVPAALAASRSSALACRMAPASRARCRLRHAAREFFVSVLRVANSRAATRARRAASCTCSRNSVTDGACTLIDPAYRTCPRRSTGVRSVTVD